MEDRDMKLFIGVRKLTNHGRLVLSKDIVSIQRGDEVEMFVDGDAIVIRKYEPNCIICNYSNAPYKFKGSGVCVACYNEIKYSKFTSKGMKLCIK